MAKLDDATGAALLAFKAAMQNGASKDVALDVALARLRRASPLATKWDLRALVAKALAAERVAGAGHQGHPDTTPNARAPDEAVN